MVHLLHRLYSVDTFAAGSIVSMAQSTTTTTALCIALHSKKYIGDNAF